MLRAYWVALVIAMCKMAPLIAQAEDSNDKSNSTGSVKDSRALFSPLVDYAEWMPLGRGDPLKNDPTFDYVPPVLERVRYWADNIPTEKKDILLLGVSSKKPSNRKDARDPYMKFIDSGKYNMAPRRNYYPLYTVLMPPPMQHHKGDTSIPVMDYSQYYQTTPPPMSTWGTTPGTLHLPPSSPAPWRIPLQEGPFIKGQVSDAAAELPLYFSIGKPDPNLNLVQKIQPEVTPRTQTLTRRPLLHTLLQKESTPAIIISPPVYTSTAKTIASPAHALTTPTITTLTPTVSPIYISTQATPSSTHASMPTSTSSPIQTSIPATVPTSAHISTPKLSSSMYFTTPATTKSTNNTSTQTANTSSIHVSIPTTTASTVFYPHSTSRQPSVFPHTHPSASPIHSTSSPSQTTPRTTTSSPLFTTDPLFSHYNQPARPLRGPMYLIIQGHSKVKNYGPKPNANHLTDEVKHLHYKPELQETVKHLHHPRQESEYRDQHPLKERKTLENLIDSKVPDLIDDLGLVPDPAFGQWPRRTLHPRRGA